MNIGTATEFVNDDPALADLYIFFLSKTSALEINIEDGLVNEVTALELIPDAVDQSELHPVLEALNEDSREAVDPREVLPPVEADNELLLTPEEMEKLYDQFEMEDDANYHFDRILDYEFKDGVCCLKRDIWMMISVNTL
jgi:hypothetical protein